MTRSVIPKGYNLAKYESKILPGMSGIGDISTSGNLFKLLKDNDFIKFRKVAEKWPFVRIACDRKGDTLLHRAVTLGKLEACKYLLERGISATYPGSNGATPLHYASQRGHMLIMYELLSAAGFQHSPINMHGITPLHVAAGEGHLAIVKMLMHRGVSGSARDKFDRLPLHYAAGTNQFEVVRWLVGKDSSLIDAPDAFGQRPIHWALEFGCLFTASWLIRRGVNLNEPDIHGRSPLDFLARSEQAILLSLLDAAGLWKEFKRIRPRRQTLLQRAIIRGERSELRQLLQEPASLNRRDELGRTPLHFAAVARNQDLFNWIREKGADAHVVDDYGWTPLKLLSYRLIKSPFIRPLASP